MAAFIGKVICVVFAFFLLRLAYKLFEKGKGPTCGLVASLGAVVLLCSFNWFQGWAKAFLSSHIISNLAELGQQVNTVQETTSDMLNDLSNHVNTAQRTTLGMLNSLSNEVNTVRVTNLVMQTQLANYQNKLGVAQTQIDNEAKQLSDVEYWVQNLYQNAQHETLTLANTNSVRTVTLTNGQTFAIIRLSHVPIAGSVEGNIRINPSFQAGAMSLGTDMPLQGDLNFLQNVAVTRLGPDMVLFIRYVADTRQTNFYQNMPELNKDIFINSTGWRLMPAR